MRTNVNIQQLDNLNKLTFSAKVTIIDLFESDPFLQKIKLLQIIQNIDNYIFKKLDKFPVANFVWKITNKLLISRIKTAPSVCGFSSEIFEAHSLKWCIDLYPNGSFKERENSVNIFVRLLSLPSKYLKINARINIEFVELGDKYELIKSAKFDGAIWGCPVSESFFDDLKEKIIDNINIKIKIEMIDIYEDRENITKYFVNNAQNNGKIIEKSNIYSDSYEWKINAINSNNLLLQRMKDAINGKKFESPIFKIFNNNFLKFNLILYPNGKDKKENGLTNIGVNLISDLPSNTTIIYTRCLLSVIELNKTVILPLKFYINNINQEWNYHFGMQRLSISQFKSLKTLTITLKMDIIDIYDNGNNITHELLSNNNNINSNNNEEKEKERDMICLYDGDRNKEMELLQSYDKRLNAIEANINEIKLMIKQQENQYKNNDDMLSIVLNEIKSIKQEIIMNQNDNDNDNDKIKFKYWLKTDVGLYQEYYQLFIKNGIDS